MPVEKYGMSCTAHVTGLSPGTAYTFRVLAINSCGASKPSTEGEPAAASPLCCLLAPRTCSRAAERCSHCCRDCTPGKGLAHQIPDKVPWTQVSCPQQQLRPARLAACD